MMARLYLSVHPPTPFIPGDTVHIAMKLFRPKVGPTIRGAGLERYRLS